MRPKVTFLTLIFSHYRLRVHELVRQHLGEAGIDYELLYSDPKGGNAKKGDTVSLPWARKIGLKSLRLAGREIHYQQAWRETADSDLVIVGQESKFLINYLLLLRYWLFGKKIAYFGHGRGYQAKKRDGLLEKLKRFMATRVHWWFAYTPGVADYLASIGFPETNITVFENSIDTRLLREEMAAIDEAAVADFRAEFGIGNGPIGLFMGGMYEEKRLDFLCQAALHIRKEIPGFHLVLVGSGSHGAIARQYAAAHDFIHCPGPRFGSARAQALMASDVFLMPGLVGLAVLDSFAAECPIVTTDYAYHSPEIEYMTSGENGLIVPDDGNPETYAHAVVDLLANQDRMAHLKQGCRDVSGKYTVEQMARNLANGMIEAVRGEHKEEIPARPVVSEEVQP